MTVVAGARYLAVIPARAGSKRVPGKNRRLLCGRPLFAWSIEHVRRCAIPMRVVVSTDDPVTAQLAAAEGVEVPGLRPADLARDEAPTEPVLLHALSVIERPEEVGHVVLLPPTSPVRDPGSLDAAVRLYEETGADSLVSVTPVSPLQWSGTPGQPVPLYDLTARPRLQTIPADLQRFRENGSIVITSVASLRATGNRLGGRNVMYVMNEHEGIDVDAEYDLWVAEQWLRRIHAD